MRGASGLTGAQADRLDSRTVHMPTSVRAVLILLAATSASAATIERIELKGAHALVVIPDDWNGSLFLYAHGYTADGRILAPIPERALDATAVLLPGLLPFVPAGYATAITTYRSIGWSTKDAIKDVENLRRWFVKKYGKPKRTYIWGHSQGGLVTEAMIELFPKTYDGAAPMCGPGAGARRLFNGAYDLRVAYDHICRDVPGARFACGLCSDGASRCVVDADCPSGQTCSGRETPAAPEDGLGPECLDFLLAEPGRFDSLDGGGAFVERVVEPCLGGDVPTPEQAARRSFLARAVQLPPEALGPSLFFASVGLAEIVHRRTGGKHAWGNVGVTYASPELTADERTTLNELVHRSEADASAVRFMRRWYEPRARTRTKVVTLHALDDALVIPEHEEKYRQAFEAAGRSNQLVQFVTPTGAHCQNANGFRPSLELLVAWVEDGVVPTPAAMNAYCGDCLAATEPGPYGTEVPERRQKGAPLRTLVCTGEVGDCPDGSTCDVGKRRCR